MKSVQDHPLIWFFALAYVFSWTFWLPAAFAGLGWIGPVPSTILHFAGGLGPMLAAVVVTALSGNRDGLARLGSRSLMGGRWLSVAIGVPAVLFFISAQLVAMIYGSMIEWRATGLGTDMPGVARPVYWLATVVFYGYGEEVGWRGFALPRLQVRFSALRASIALTLAWAGWHLPLFAFSTGLSSLGVFGALGWLVSLMLGSILLTCLFNSSGGSIAAVALFHAVLDIFTTSPVSPYLPNVMGALLTVGTLSLIPIFGTQNLARRPRVVEPPIQRWSV